MFHSSSPQILTFKVMKTLLILALLFFFTISSQALNYAGIWYLRYRNQTFQAQIEVAVVDAAQAIISESPATPDHANRILWANYAINNSAVAFSPFIWQVVLNPTIQSDSGPQGSSPIFDSDIQFVVNSIVQQIADIYAANPASGG